MIDFFVFLFGLAVGSFLNCLIYRLEKGNSFLKGRSFCPHCQHILGWPDLIPLFSFFILKGKCRYCHQKISWQYPLVELATAIIFLFLFLFFGLNNYTIVYLFILSCFLIIIFVYDLKHYLIPDKIIYPAIAITLFYRLVEVLEFSIFNPFLNSLLSAFGAGFFFLLIFLISKGRWMGFGDFKLGILMGLILGWPKVLVALFSAFLLGAIIGIGLIILGKKTLKSEIPFAPFLVGGTFFSLFFGQNLIQCYLHLKVLP